jgi:putative colanic acid biosynthesis UDP-glucose lipid carrier transferase
MISARTAGLHSLLVLIQGCLALSLFWLMVLGFNAREDLYLRRYALYSLVVVLGLGLEFLRRDRLAIRTAVFERTFVRLHRIAFRQAFVVLVALGLAVTLLKDATLSRLFLISYVGGLYTVLLLSNRCLPKQLASNIFRGVREHNTLIIGESWDSPPLLRWLERKADFGFRTVGALSDSPRTEQPCAGLPVLGRLQELERVIRERQVSQIIVLGIPLIRGEAYAFVSRVCNARGIRLLILSDLEEHLHHPVVHVEDDGLQFITPRQEPLENPLKRALKRALDLAVSIPVLLCIIPPVALLVWILQRLQSPGPLFYLQTRAGIQNRAFRIYKFRTMHPGNREVSRQATRDDERVFSGGRWLRKLSLDELPQFLNVLLGEMSVVGPRPHLVEHNQEFAALLDNYQVRAYVRPGITGLAQVRGFRGGATEAAIAARLEADVLYLENWSLALDMGIILRTAWQILRPPKTAF